MTVTLDPRAVERVMHGQLIGHEAGHAASALLLGLHVKSATAPYLTLADYDDADDDAIAGQVRMRVDRDDHDAVRRYAIATITGRLEDGDAYWPPRWPLTLAPEPGDEANLIEAVKMLGLDRRGYADLVADALELAGSPEYERLHVAISRALELHERLDTRGLTMVKAIAEGASVKTKRLNVPVTDSVTLDEGEMLAYASTFHNVDKVGDRVMPGAFTDTIRMVKDGGHLPLVWGHDVHGSPQNFVGQVIDADETSEGLQVHARFDLEDAVARKAWRLVRDGSIDKLSIGYSIPPGGERRGEDGANELHKVNLHEVSLVLTPANDQARVLAVKSADELAVIREETRSLITAAMRHNHSKRLDPAALRRKAERIEREHALVTVATFDC